jgi:hypothetical protein
MPLPRGGGVRPGWLSAGAAAPLAVLLLVLAVVGGAALAWVRLARKASPLEAFTGAPSLLPTNVVRCPHGMKLFADETGALRCCAGCVDDFAHTCAPGSEQCSLSAAGTGVPTCSAHLASKLGALALRECPPSLPHMREHPLTGLRTCCSNSACARSCTVGRTDASGCLAARLAESYVCPRATPTLDVSSGPVAKCVSALQNGQVSFCYVREAVDLYTAAGSSRSHLTPRCS